MSVVPTIYTVASPNPLGFSSKSTIVTNQYAVTSEEREIGENVVPGIFFKYDIEPLMLTIDERRDSFLRFAVKVVNILSGVLVAGHWGFTLSEWIVEVLGKRRRARSDGVLNGRAGHAD
jgi:endoplasmic reticulum-Golgi intermediate compartment protein 2